MTTPKELRHLLESAAKACGIEACWSSSLEDWQKDITAPTVDGQDWQPHLPGKDSEELAVELYIHVLYGVGGVAGECGLKDWYERYADHPSKAHAKCMAVLRVAAQIGEAMK